jgi:hypothetical protein
MLKRNTLRYRRLTIERLEGELARLEPYEEIARAIRERTVDRATTSGDLEAAYREAVAHVEHARRTEMLLATFDAMPAATRYRILHATFEDEEIEALLESRRVLALESARRDLAAAEIVREVRSARRLDVRLLREGQLLEVGLFQRHRVDGALRLGKRSDFCSRALTLHSTGVDGTLRVVADRLMLRGAYDGASEYPRREWERDVLADHCVVRLGVAVVDGDRESFDPTIYPGSRLDVASGDTIAKTRLSVGYVEVDGHDLFTTPA